MKRYKKLFALFAAFSLMFSAFLVTPVYAENDADVLISQLIGYYADFIYKNKWILLLVLIILIINTKSSNYVEEDNEDNI